MDQSSSRGWRRWLPSFSDHHSQPVDDDDNSRTRILIVDDESNVRLMYRSALAGLGHDLIEAATAESALDKLKERYHHVGILDLKLPGMDGLELLEHMIDLGITTPVAFVTAHGQPPDAVRAMELGAIDFLPKPPTPDQLRDIVKDILLRHAHLPKASGEKDFDYYLRSAKRAINLRDFSSATEHLIKALDIDSGSRQAINLVGVMIEMRQEHERSAKH
jgi:DNA-binding NtrC family response regulator